jgi:hypothetical protein
MWPSDPEVKRMKEEFMPVVQSVIVAQDESRNKPNPTHFALFLDETRNNIIERLLNPQKVHEHEILFEFEELPKSNDPGQAYITSSLAYDIPNRVQHVPDVKVPNFKQSNTQIRVSFKGLNTPMLGFRLAMIALIS